MDQTDRTDYIDQIDEIISCLCANVLSSCLETLQGADAVVFAVRHQPYLSLTADAIVKMTGRPVVVVDCFGILGDSKIRRYFELGCEVKGLGRGHMKRIKDETKANRKTQ